MHCCCRCWFVCDFCMSKETWTVIIVPSSSSWAISRSKNWLRRHALGSLSLMSFKVGLSGEFLTVQAYCSVAYALIICCNQQYIYLSFYILCSISNLGMFPVDHFCAIINPPQVLSLSLTHTFSCACTCACLYVSMQTSVLFTQRICCSCLNTWLQCSCHHYRLLCHNTCQITSY